LLLWARRAGNIDRQRQSPDAAAARRSSANASSDTLSADVITAYAGGFRLPVTRAARAAAAI